MNDDTISFTDAAKADAQRVLAASARGQRVVRVTGRRVHILADGVWRSYSLSELIVDLRCDHCGRPAQRLDRVVKYGKHGWFTCCLQCVEWHEARGCPHSSVGRHR
jgi:hypothetical protein